MSTFDGLNDEPAYVINVLTEGDSRRRAAIPAMVGGRVDLARKPLRLRGSLFDLRNLA
jgi:hypothetical protein